MIIFPFLSITLNGMGYIYGSISDLWALIVFGEISLFTVLVLKIVYGEEEMCGNTMWSVEDIKKVNGMEKNQFDANKLSLYPSTSEVSELEKTL